MRRFQELSPVNERDRFFDSQSFTALWASLAFSLPAVVVGVRLTADATAGGLGLTLGQLLFVVPLAAVVGAVILAAVSSAAADQGIPAGLILRPGFGVAGSWVASVMITLFYVMWAALELQVGGRTVVAALRRAEIVSLDDRLAIGVFGLGVAALIFLGLSATTQWWIRRFAFWAVLVVFAIGLVAALGGLGDGVLETVPRQQGFWLGVDMILGAMIIWFPLAADTGRFARDSSIAVSGTGYGFGVAASGAVLLGGLAGLSRIIEPSPAGVTTAVLTSGSSVVVVVLLFWILAGELDQPFGFIYGAATSVSSTVLRRPPGYLGETLVAGAIAAAMLVAEDSLTRAIEFLITIIAPMAAILLADFYVVRRRHYLTDDLYDRSGAYRGVNLFGVAAFLVSFLVVQWIEPSGPVGWTDTIIDLIPSAGSMAERGLPPIIVGMVVAFLVYTGLGLWRIRETDKVSSVRL